MSNTFPTTPFVGEGIIEIDGPGFVDGFEDEKGDFTPDRQARNQAAAIELIKREFRIQIVNSEAMPAFGAALIPDDPEKDEPIIALNVGSCLLCSVEEETDFKEIVLETLMHEFGHVLESWLALEVSEERIEALVMAYREKYGAAECVLEKS